MSEFEGLLLVPLLTGLPLAYALPWLGHYLRLRQQWLAALALAHLSALGALGAIALEAPPALGAWLTASLGAVVRVTMGQKGNSAHAVWMLAAWSATLLIAANTRLGEALAHGLVDGHLYFAGWRELVLAWLGLLSMTLLLPRIAPALVNACYFPWRERANRLPSWRWHLGFELLVAATMAIAIQALGVMAAFALIFLPPWMAWAIATHARAAIVLAVALAVFAYLAAFAGAWVFDQPFGPFLTATLLVAVAACRGGVALFRRTGAGGYHRRHGR